MMNPEYRKKLEDALKGIEQAMDADSPSEVYHRIDGALDILRAEPEAWMSSSKLGSIPEGAVIAWRRKRKPHHNWQHGIYVENDSKARDQFSLGGCDVMVIEWPTNPNAHPQ